MSFSVSGFKSEVATQGFLRPSNYDVMIYAPVSGLEHVRLRTESVSAPGAAFLSVDGYRPYSTGKIYNIPYAYNPQSITCIHTIDGNANLYQSFWNWLDLIGDLSGEHKHAANYFDEFKGEMLIRIKEPSGGPVKLISLREVYPETIDQMQLSWASADEIVKLSVTYRYTNFRMLS